MQWLPRLSPRTRRAIFVGLVIPMAACVMVEIAMAVLVPQPVAVPREDVGGTVHLRRNITFTVSSDEFSNTVVTNSQGFYDREHATPKPPGTKRVLVLGDSMVEAVQVPLAQNLCSRLEGHLGAGFEVINMGIAGAGQAHEYLVLQDQGARSGPDVVVLCFYASNDIYNNSPLLEEKRNKPFFVERDGRLELLGGGMTPTLVPFVDSPLWPLSHLYRFVVRHVMRVVEANRVYDVDHGVARPQLVFMASPPPVWQQAWSITEALLRAIDAQTRAMNARLLVALLPCKTQVLQREASALPSGTDWDVDAPHRRLSRFCQQQGIPCIDLVAPFREAVRGGAKPFFLHDEHFTADGHALAARLLAEKARELAR